MPTPDEAEILRRNFQYHLDYFSDKPEQVKRYLAHGEGLVDRALNQRELAAYASVAIGLVALVAWLAIDGWRQQRLVDELEARGVRRRSIRAE